MDIESALKVLEDLPGQPDKVKELSPAVRQRVLALAKNLPTLVYTPEQIAFMQIMEVSWPSKRIKASGLLTRPDTPTPVWHSHGRGPAHLPHTRRPCRDAHLLG